MKQWRVTGVRFGRPFSKVLDADTHSAAMIKATKIMHVVNSCVLVTTGVK